MKALQGNTVLYSWHYCTTQSQPSYLISLITLLLLSHINQVLYKFMTQKSNLKKEGLHLIIDSYLTQSTPAALQFLAKHIGSTEELATSLGSNVNDGLSHEQLALNLQFYGKNKLKYDQISTFQRFCKILTQELFQYRTAMILLLFVFEIVCSHVWNIYQLQLVSITIIVSVLVSWTLKIGVSWRQKMIIEHRYHLAEPINIIVYRAGQKVSIPEEDITVGDLVFVDYNQTVPASGILVSSDELELNQTKYGKGYQAKMALQECLDSLNQKNQLQMRIDVESGALASPVILRGTKNSSGTTFKMLILAVNEYEILQKQLTGKYQEGSVSAVQVWINNITQNVRKFCSAILTTIIFFHLLALIFKIMGLPKGNFVPFASTVIENLQAMVCLSLLCDVGLIKCLLRGSYLQVAGLLGIRQNIDRFLAVEQLFVNEESICKYDSIVPKKIVLLDLPEPIDINLLPALKPEKAYALLYEILAGVGFEEGLATPKTSKKHRNTIIHLFSLQERVFSSFYAACPNTQKQQATGDQGNSLSQLMRTQGHLMVRQCNSNRITPQSQIQEVSKRQKSHSIQFALMQNETAKGHQEKYEGGTKNVVKLDEYLSKHCHFSTQNILEGINKLARNVSRTYFFQLYSLQRLSQIRSIWSEGRFLPADTERQEQLMLGIKRLEKEGLTPYLIGFDEGAFSKKYMNHLLGILGVEASYEEQVIYKLNLLEEMGVHSLFTIQEYEQEKITDKYAKMIQRQFLHRAWAQPQHHFGPIDMVREKGGRLICIECLTSKCKCRARKEQLANPQGFLEAVYNLRCVWSVTEKDLKYLQQGFQQLGMTTLRLLDHEEDMPRKLDQIIAGNELFHALQQNLALWIAWLASVTLCFFPFNYLTFDNILTHAQLYVALIYFQLLIVRHSFAGSASLFKSNSLTRSKRRRQMLGLALKAEIAVFVICMTLVCYVILTYPRLLSGNIPREGLAGFTCKQVDSFYHNPLIAKAFCENITEKVINFSKVGTFIFLFILISFTIRSAITISKPYSKQNLLFHCVMVGLLLLITYLAPEYLQTAYSGLSIGQLGACLGLALGVVCLGALTRGMIVMTQGGKIFHFEVKIGQNTNQYAELLKEHIQGKTLQFSLQKKPYSYR